MSQLVEHFDHFVVPVDDLVQAEDFYINVLGARQAYNARGPMRYGLNVHQTIHGMRPHTFFVAAGKRIGAYLQTEHRPPQPKGRGAPTYSFETTQEGLNALMGRLKKANVGYEGPLADAPAFARSTIFFDDPTGNHLAVYVPKEPNSTSKHPHPADDPLIAIGYLQLEAPDLEKSIRFYCDTFSLPTPDRNVDPLWGSNHARIKMPSGQSLVLTQAPVSSKGMIINRFEPGPHLAFYLPAARWGEMMARLEKCGVQHGDRAAILMRNTETNNVDMIAVRTRDGKASGEVKVSRSVVNDVLEKGISSFTDDALADERYVGGESIVRQRIRSVMCAPMRTTEDILGVLYVDSQVVRDFSEADLELLAAIGNQAGIALHRARLMAEVERLFLDVMKAIASIIDAKDGYTHKHSERVAAFGVRLARHLGFDADSRAVVELSGLLHDVGKIGVPDAILNKPGKLTDSEFKEMRLHPLHGARILSNIEPEGGEPAARREVPPRAVGRQGLPGRDRKSTRLNSSHVSESRMPSSA